MSRAIMNNVYPLRKKIRDFGSRKANEAAALQVKSYWAAKGHDVKVEVIEHGWRCYGINSDLLNGLPQDVFVKRTTAAAMAKAS